MQIHKTSRTETTMKEFDIYWPGTKILKTRHNAFNWQGKPSQIMQLQEMKNINQAKQQKVNLTQNANKNPTYC